MIRILDPGNVVFPFSTLLDNAEGGSKTWLVPTITILPLAVLLLWWARARAQRESQIKRVITAARKMMPYPEQFDVKALARELAIPVARVCDILYAHDLLPKRDTVDYWSNATHQSHKSCAGDVPKRDTVDYWSNATHQSDKSCAGDVSVCAQCSDTQERGTLLVCSKCGRLVCATCVGRTHVARHGWPRVSGVTGRDAKMVGLMMMIDKLADLGRAPCPLCGSETVRHAS